MYSPRQSTLRRSQPNFTSLRDTLLPLDFQASFTKNADIEAYCEYYHLTFPETVHHIGTFQTGKFDVAAQIFSPAPQENIPIRGTVFLLHGYIDHTGILRHLIRNCVEQGMVAATYDLPGHGLSSGERMSINNFADYTEVFQTFLAQYQPQLPPPYYFIGHSTGCAVAFDYFSQTPEHPFKRIIFLAPLVRHVHWHLSKIPYTFGKIFHVPTVPRRYSKISSDPTFLEFLRRDPLQTDHVPFRWISALYEWNRQIQHTRPFALHTLILQGTSDTVVDWKYNIPFLRQKLQGARVEWIEEAGHHLINEIPSYRNNVLHRINTYLHEGNNFTFQKNSGSLFTESSDFSRKSLSKRLIF